MSSNLNCPGCQKPLGGESWRIKLPPGDADVLVHRKNECARLFIDRHWGTIGKFWFSVMFFLPQDDDPTKTYFTLAEGIEALGDRRGIVWMNALGVVGPGHNIYEQS